MARSSQSVACEPEAHILHLSSRFLDTLDILICSLDTLDILICSLDTLDILICLMSVYQGRYLRETGGQLIPSRKKKKRKKKKKKEKKEKKKKEGNYE